MARHIPNDLGVIERQNSRAVTASGSVVDATHDLHVLPRHGYSRGSVFALPPAELAAHPTSADGGGYELHLMCDNIEATVRELAAKGVEFSSGVTQQRWGLITTIKLPGGSRLGLYEPLHASPLVSPT